MYLRDFPWSCLTDLNRRPLPYQSGELYLIFFSSAEQTACLRCFVNLSFSLF